MGKLGSERQEGHTARIPWGLKPSLCDSRPLTEGYTASHSLLGGEVRRAGTEAGMEAGTEAGRAPWEGWDSILRSVGNH